MKKMLQEITDMVIEGEDEEIGELVQTVIDAGVLPQRILKEGLVRAMDIVGPLMASGEMYVPEVLMCADTMRAGIDVLKPYLSAEDSVALGKVIIGSVQGDLHDIGKNLVCMMLETSGFDVIDIGIDQSKEKFEAAIKKETPDIVALSALLTTTMPALKETTQYIKNKGYEVKIIIGGAPIDQAYAYEIGANGFAPDGGSAVVVAKKLLGINLSL